ncbi:MAG: response regulator [Acidobacteria bacterium]|nr:response regulator [Acidobacteriota bacterium]
MASARILVVEDERIVAKDLQSQLEKLGYAVPGVASSGAEALQKAAETRPDLILMDIRLKGEMDGVETSQLVRDQFNIPVIYLTAYADENTLKRAKITEPFGYIVKPFEERELRTNIEIALYKHRMERKLRESELWLATTLKSIGDGVITTDSRERVTFMNRVAEALTGWKQEDAVGKELTQVLTILHKETRASAENPVTKALQEGQVVELAMDTVLVSSDGEEIPIADTAAPIVDDKGNLAGAVLVFRDITEHRRVEESLRESHKMEAVGRLAGGVAHEFNNLLMVIRGYSELLLQRSSANDLVRTNAEEIRKAADRAASLTRQLLAFSRKQVLQPKVLDLNAVVTEVEKMLRRLIGEDIELVTALEPGLGPVKADPGQIEQIILNLAVNARDAMPRGGRLTLETSNVELDEDFARQHSSVASGPHVLLTVSDTGTGMDAETQSHIFEPFFTTKGWAKSTGLGLATIHGIVKQSGGIIWVESAPGRGTTFKFYLPRVEEAAAAEGKSTGLTTPSRNSETILVVEDEEGVRQLMREFLAGKGYTILEARDGTEAIQLAQQHRGPIHLLMTDVVMPGMSGGDLAQRLASLRPETKVIFVSGYTDDAIVQHGVREEGTVFLQKPFSLDALARTVREVLDSKGKK